jgi:hypothetical protein
MPAGWMGSVQATGVNADGFPVGLKVDTALMNVTWKWVGTTRVDAPYDFGLFTFDLTGSGAYSGSRLFFGQCSGSGSPRVLTGRTTGPTSVIP